MKKFSLLLSAILVAMLNFVLVSCGDEEENQPTFTGNIDITFTGDEYAQQGDDSFIIAVYTSVECDLIVVYIDGVKSETFQNKSNFILGPLNTQSVGNHTIKVEAQKGNSHATNTFKFSVLEQGTEYHGVSEDILGYFRHYCQKEHDGQAHDYCAPSSYMMVASCLYYYYYKDPYGYPCDWSKLQELIKVSNYTWISTWQDYANSTDSWFLKSSKEAKGNSSDLLSKLRKAFDNNQFVITSFNGDVYNNKTYINDDSHYSKDPSVNKELNLSTKSYFRKLTGGSALTHVFLLIGVSTDANGKSIVTYIDPLAETRDGSNRRYVDLEVLYQSMGTNIFYFGLNDNPKHFVTTPEFEINADTYDLYVGDQVSGTVRITNGVSSVISITNNGKVVGSYTGTEANFSFTASQEGSNKLSVVVRAQNDDTEFTKTLDYSILEKTTSNSEAPTINVSYNDYPTPRIYENVAISVMISNSVNSEISLYDDNGKMVKSITGTSLNYNTEFDYAGSYSFTVKAKSTNGGNEVSKTITIDVEKIPTDNWDGNYNDNITTTIGGKKYNLIPNMSAIYDSHAGAPCSYYAGKGDIWFVKSDQSNFIGGSEASTLLVVKANSLAEIKNGITNSMIVASYTANGEAKIKMNIKGWNTITKSTRYFCITYHTYVDKNGYTQNDGYYWGPLTLSQL